MQRHVRRRKRGCWVGVSPLDESLPQRSREGVHAAREGQSKRNPAPTWDEPPAVLARQVDGPARGLGSTEGLQPLVVDTARRPVGGRTRQTPHGANPVPANQSTHEGKTATGCGITGMPTASGIPRPNPWEEVKEGSTSFCLGMSEDRTVVSSAGRRPRNRRGLPAVPRIVSGSSLVVFAPPRS